MRRSGLSIALLAGAALCAGLGRPAAAPPAATPRTIEMHVGVPGWAALGVPHKELIDRFPGAEVTAFSGQDDALTVKIPGAGISCMVVGATPGELKVASLGFNLDGEYEGIPEGSFRTDRGVGKGSTVNDLLEAYGQPAEVVADRAARRSQRRQPDFDEAALPQLYQYRSADGAVTTSFVVQRHRVVRVVINALEPLKQHLLRQRSRESSRTGS